MADGTAHSRYVKLTKDQAPAEDIKPGELNQPIEVPRSNVHRCHQCGQPLPESDLPPRDEPWTTGIFGCAEDRESCLTGLFCPCVLFGRNVMSQSVSNETPWHRPCICHAACVCIEGGMALAALTAIFHGIDPWISITICEGLLCSWWMRVVCAGLVRQALQKKYHLQDSPCHPCLTHSCLHWCALCQEHREMKGRLSDNALMPMTVVNPPQVQEMKSADDNQDSASPSSTNNSGHTDLQMQAL